MKDDYGGLGSWLKGQIILVEKDHQVHTEGYTETL
jgi:hypothetical protein